MRRRRIAAVALPAFLVAHLFCLCLSATATVPPRPAAHHDGGHDCCPGGASNEAPRPAHAPSCAHCGGTQLGVSQGTPVIAPAMLVTAMAIPSHTITAATAWRAVHGSRVSRGSPPGATPLERTCVLIV